MYRIIIRRLFNSALCVLILTACSPGGLSVTATKMVAKLAPLTEQELKHFIDENSHYFSEREVFQTVVFIFENHPNKLDMHSLESEVKTADTLKMALNEKGVSFQAVSTQFSTDGLPQVIG